MGLEGLHFWVPEMVTVEVKGPEDLSRIRDSVSGPDPSPIQKRSLKTDPNPPDEGPGEYTTVSEVEE